MNNLQSSLVNTGLADDKVLAKNLQNEKTVVSQHIASVNKKVSRNPSLLKLESVGSVSQFKQEAKQILLDDYSLVEEILNLAQGLKNLDGGKKLLWLLYSTKGNIFKAKPEFVKQIIKRAFRKSNPTVEFKKEWFQR
ncbi:hypothetical protein K8R62_02695 [bacterium]|nr:hypothetical protein [bacterium]